MDTHEHRVTGPDGTFAFDSLPSGVYRFRAALTRFRSIQQDSVVVRCESTTTLRLRLVQVNFEPVESLQVKTLERLAE